MTEQTVVTGDEVAGLLAPEIAAMSRELETLRSSNAAKDAEIVSLDSRLSEAYREIDSQYNRAIVGQTLLTEMRRELVQVSKELANSARTGQLLTSKLDVAADETLALHNYMLRVLAGENTKVREQLAYNTPFELVHLFVIDAEFAIPEPRPYIASEAVERRLLEIAERRSEVVAAHAAATAAVSTHHPMQESSHENSSTSGEVLQSE